MAAGTVGLKRFAYEVRKDIVFMAHAAQPGHPRGSLSAVEGPFFIRLIREKFPVLNAEGARPFELGKAHTVREAEALLARKAGG